jgi:NarL family two-component system response regulator LiaR
MIDKISLLIADDHALVRQGIRAFLELQPDLMVIGEADSGEAAVRMAHEDEYIFPALRAGALS